jgi:DNA uptake protein ComE-like DNA-binding protein
MRGLRVLLVLVFAAGPMVKLQAQSKGELKTSVIQQRIEFIAEQTERDDLDYTTLFDELAYYYENPLNINEASVDELQSLAVLTPFQAIALRNYIEQYGKLSTVYELRNIPELDAVTIQAVLPFIRVEGPPSKNTFSFKKVAQTGRHEAIVRYSAVLEEQKGFTPRESDGETPYEGSKDRIYTRYRFQAGQLFSAGITGEKDAGETFGKGSNPNGFDFYSAHLFARNIGPVKQIAIGDYQAQFGQGLTFWSGLNFGKTGQGTNAMRFAPRLRPYTSANENLFLRGAGITLGGKRWDATLFYSNKNIDAGIADADTLDPEDLTFTSLQISGLHRTEGEIRGEDALGEEIAGAHAAYKTEHLELGVTGVYSRYDGISARNLQLYNRFDFNDNENFNSGLDFKWMYKGMSVFGEVSHSKNGATAYLAGAQFKPHSQLELVVLQRNYPKDYQAVYGAAFGEGRRNQNERGTYIGANFFIAPKLTLSGYFDRYRFEWMRFRIDRPSDGADWNAQLNYTVNRDVSFYFRYREEHQERNPVSDLAGRVNQPALTKRRSIRFHIDYDLTNNLSLANRIEVSQFDEQNQSLERGFLIYQDVKYSFWEDRIALYGRAVLFDVDDFDARIYTYENDVLYFFSVPALQDQGVRMYAMARVKFNSKVSFWVRWSRTTFTNRYTVGSANEEIAGPTRNDIRLQLRVRL